MFRRRPILFPRRRWRRRMLRGLRPGCLVWCLPFLAVFVLFAGRFSLEIIHLPLWLYETKEAGLTY